MVMKKFAAICTLIAFCAGQGFVLADNNKDKDKDKGKKVPPGLEKKGGLPPGIAKKQQQGDTPQTAPAVSTPAAPAPAPAAAPAPAVAPAATKPVGTSANTPATQTTATKKPATFAEQKAKIDTHMRAINEADNRPRLKAIAIQQIAKEAGMKADRIEQQEKNHPGIRTATLLFGNLIAKQSGAEFHDVVTKHMKGMHWGDIARAHKVDVGPLIQKASDVAAVVRAAETAFVR